jgi:ribonuclease Z
MLLLALSIASFYANAQDAPIRVTLLGTGAPVPSMERFGPSILVEAGQQKLLFDCGRGAAQRLWQLKIPLRQVNVLFLTHLHSDHVVGIPDLWLTGWIPSAFGRRELPFRVIGPAGTKDMMTNMQKSFAWDIQTRSKERNKVDSGALVNARDIEEGFVWEQEGVKVTPFTVRHAEFIDSALGYRIDYAGHSVILSGDTRYSENLVRYAKGADVVVHEVAAAQEDSTKNPALIKQILGFHTSPEDAGRVFQQVQPKLAVFSHIVLLSPDPAVPPPTTSELISRTKKTYNGEVQVGEDLLIIEIGDKVKLVKYVPTDKPQISK